MWAAEQRTRHKVRVPKERKGYPTDISDQEWKLVEPLLPGVARTGRPRKTELRQGINALRYLVRSGCEWRMLPNRFPTLPNGLLLVPSPDTALPFPNDPRLGTDARPDVRAA